MLIVIVDLDVVSTQLNNGVDKTTNTFYSVF